jgi:DNA repair photolyase
MGKSMTVKQKPGEELIDGKRVHELAKLLPPMSDAELAALVEDVKANGLIEPIVLLDGQILDGVHRLRACIQAKMKPKYRNWDGECGTPFQFVCTKNLSRRNLSRSQRAVVALSVEEELATKAKRRMSSKERAKDGVEEIPHPGDKGRARDAAALICCVNPRYISDAKKISREKPELLQRILRGELIIPEALKMLDTRDTKPRPKLNRTKNTDLRREHVTAVSEMVRLVRRARLTIPEAEAASAIEEVEQALHRIWGKATKAEKRLETGLRVPLNVYAAERGEGIRPSNEFAKKRLCNYSVNVGMCCGHQCTYCSSRAQLRTQKVYRNLLLNPYDHGYAIIDTRTPERLLRKIPPLTAKDTIQLCTLDDAWSPEAREYGIGHRTLEVLLKETPAQIRILTKSAEVAKDFGVAKGFESRVIVGLSTGIPASREEPAAAIEPNASPIRDRLKALRNAHSLGLRTYGMLCPVLPCVADGAEALEEMFDAVLDCGVEDIWLEPVNGRGGGILRTVEALRLAGLNREAEAADLIRKKDAWSQYATALIENAIAAAKKKKALDRLHILLYPKRLTPPDREKLQQHKKGIIWLEEEDGFEEPEEGSPEKEDIPGQRRLSSPTT